MIKTIDHHITISLSWLSSYSLARGARLSSQPAGRYTCCHETLDYCNTLLQEAASRYWIRFSVSWTVQHQWYSVERVVTTWHHCSETVYIYTGFTSVNEWRSHYVCSSISHFTDWDQATSLAHGLRPSYITGMLVSLSSVGTRASLRSSARRDLEVPRTRLQVGKQAFSVAGPAAWNNLPTHV